MKASNYLYDLIHSLEPAEKKYIKKYARLSTKSKHNYQKLFEAINQQTSYDENALLIKFRRAPFVKHFAVAKNQLFELILKLLRQYHQNNSASALINAAIENGRLLYNRGLSSLAFKQLDKAYKLAKEYAEYLKMQEILDLKRHYKGQLKAHDLQEEMETLLQEKETLLKAELEYLSYERIYQQVLVLIRKNLQFRNQQQQQALEEVLPDGVLNPPKYKEHFHSQLRYLNSKNIYFFLKKNYIASIACSKKVIALWDQSPKLRQQEAERYIAALNNYMNCTYLDEDWAAINHVIPKLKNITAQSIRIQAIIFESETIWKLNNYQALGRYDDLLKMIPEMETSLIRLKDSMHEIRHFMIIRSIGMIYFIFGDYHKALEYINQTLALKHLALREDLQLFVNMMLLFTHYHLDHIIFLDSALKNYRRKIKKKGLLYELEDFQFKLLQKLCAASDRTTKLNVLTTSQEELSRLVEQNPNLSTLLRSHLDLAIWIKSVQQNCTMKVLLEQKTDQE
ncbi:hypothetical protein [Aureispira anguillae]|uniref:Tetratricopeptide repeat protein n=1 Tax=Aureispira anguillae TaxID=2864201 RepID=A0A915YK42_9BACT|nr:hypothetical protein [Aureispira anguillae]BDS14479.1 hypothetical protein AsAng_0052590 [Aureispira anguillae]